jgi:anti-anti-sigma regulatory factor
MMKIQTTALPDGLVIQVEGRLAGLFVPELERFWKSARATRRNETISIDLRNVTCVDRAGRCLLRLMHAQGVAFLRAGLATQDILDQVIEDDCL